MINYHVKKRRRTRYTYRMLGFTVILVCGTQIAMFLMGYGRSHMFGSLVAFILLLYGLYLFVNSFRAGAYDMDFEFKDEEFIVHTKWGDRRYSYKEVEDVSQVVPENELIYSLLHINVGKHNYVLPFSYKKEVADKIYNFVNDRAMAEKLNDEQMSE